MTPLFIGLPEGVNAFGTQGESTEEYRGGVFKLLLILWGSRGHLTIYGPIMLYLFPHREDSASWRESVILRVETQSKG